MDDAENLFPLRTSIEVMKYIQKPLARSIADVYEMINKIDAGINGNESVAWAIELHEQPGLIGTIGYHTIDHEHSRAELGYMLDEQYWNKGYMNDALKKVLDFGFLHLQLHSVEAKLNKDNTYSIRLLQKNGFCKEACLKENYYFEGAYFDTEIYSLLQKDHLKTEQ